MTAFGSLLLYAIALPSWKSLESKLPPANPTIFEDALPSNDAAIAKSMPVLYRDKNAICPYCEQVWLALEAKNVEYATVLVPTPTTKSPLKVTWQDGTEQTNSLDILERIEKEYPSNKPNLYPKGISECVDSVRCNIVRFQPVFPRRTNSDNIYAPFLFLENGGLVTTSNHMVTLEETDEVLEEYYQGPFLCGKQFTAADVIWAPFLERYAVQLPLLLPGLDELNPRGGGDYETLEEWYEAMETQVPCYSCRIQGDVEQWRRALAVGIQQYNEEHGESIELSSDKNDPIFSYSEIDGDSLWKQYTETRPWLADSPEEECVAFLVRNRETLIADAVAALSLDADEVDTALREVIGTLLDDKNDGEKLSGNARDVAAFARQQIWIPRDMGIVPAATLSRIVERSPAPRIA